MKNSKLLGKEIYWLIKEKYKGRPDSRINKDILRLKKGEPIAYVIEFADFLGCKIDLSLRTFIPEPETEYWLGEVLRDICKDRGGRKKCLDIFSGSGCIGMAVLKHIKNSKVDFADVDKVCLKQIKRNLNLNKINPKRYKLIRSDVLKNIKEKYDYIFANPPYIARSRAGKIHKSVLKFEPKLALFGGKDGFLLIDELLKGAKENLKKGGKIFFEFDPSQKNKILQIIKKYRYSRCQLHKDQYKRWRMAEILN